MAPAIVNAMFATVAPAEINSTEDANESRRQKLRPLGSLLLISFLIHLMLLWGLKKKHMFIELNTVTLSTPMSIRLQIQPTYTHHTSSISHERQEPVHSLRLPATEPVAVTKVDVIPQDDDTVTDTLTTSALPHRIVSEMSQAEQQENFLAQVHSLIESHKFYPDSARRLGMQGTIQVSFVVNPDGSVSQVICRGGTRLLQNAAEQALRSAAPFPARQSGSLLPLQVNYETTFALD